VWSNKFIWGLDKTGFECVDCEIAVSRKYIGEAKKTICEGLPTLMTVRGTNTSQTQPIVAGSKIFTIHLPEGQRRSIMMNPMQKLSDVIGKICRDRDWKVSDYVACDSNGTELDLRILLGQIKSFEITFTPRDASSSSTMRPPLISDVRAKLESEGALLSTASKRLSKKSRNTLSNTDERSGEASGEQSPRSPAGRGSWGDDTDSGRITSGRKVKECYIIADKELGTGAFSTVLLATDKNTQQEVAIKVIDKSDAGTDEEQSNKFRIEFEIHSQLLHDHIVHFIMMDETEDSYFVVMELVSGGELFDQVIERGQFAERDAAQIVCQVLTALSYMHKKGIAHRDLKPENLLFKDRTYQTIKIADFGESKLCAGRSLSTYCGTPDYMAPEIIQGKPYGPEVDMWALGCIAYIMMAGFPPFDGENDAEILSSILSIRYDFPSPEWDGYSKEALDFIAHLLVAEPDRRLQASQALDHPWIKMHCTDSQRTVAGKPPGSIPNLPELVLPRLDSNRRKSMGSRTKSAEGSSSKAETSPKMSPRGSSSFDSLDLIALQQPFDEHADKAKSQLLAGIDVLSRLATSKGQVYPNEELYSIMALAQIIPDQAASRSPFEVTFLRASWLRLQSIKNFLQTRKDKKKMLGSKAKKDRK